MGQGSNETDLKRLHKDLWIYSIWILLWAVICLYGHHIVWLVLPLILGFCFWVGRYFINNPQYTFPYGPANAITVVRLCFLCTIAMMNVLLPSIVLGCVLGLICLADILDGYIARALNMTTTIGEYLDKEVDAVFVLLAVILLYLRGYTGLWIVWAGFMRYIYFIVFYFIIRPGVKEHKDPFAKVIAVFVFISLIAAFIIPMSISLPLVVIATALLTYSFVRVGLFEAGILT